MFEILKNWYELTYEDNDSLKYWVIGKVITPAEYEQITGVVYS